MVNCLILSHGRIADSYLEAAQKIVGECENLHALNGQGLSLNMLYQKITHLIESKNLIDGLFILVSLKGGSYWNVAAKIAKEYEKVELISGVNLSIILSFITKCHQFDFEELGEILKQDGIRAITRLK